MNNGHLWPSSKLGDYSTTGFSVMKSILIALMKSILIVDDNRFIRRCIHQTLEEQA